MKRAKQNLTAFNGRLKKWQEVLREPGLTGLLIVEVLLIFFAIPFTGMGWLPDYALPTLFALLVIATLIVTLRSKVAALLVLASVLLGPLASLIHATEPSVLTDWLSAGGRLLAIAALSVVIAQAVFGPGPVTVHRVQGAVVLYLNFGLFFFTIYRLIDMLKPGSFSGLVSADAEFHSGAGLLYFSFSTLTTTGFGDIAPLHPLGRSLANLELVIGQLYPATLLARLVSLELASRRQPRGD